MSHLGSRLEPAKGSLVPSHPGFPSPTNVGKHGSSKLPPQEREPCERAEDAVGTTRSSQLFRPVGYLQTATTAPSGDSWAGGGGGALTWMQWYVALVAQTRFLLGQPSRSESSPQMSPSPA